jgi:hypothetical protein
MNYQGTVSNISSFDYQDPRSGKTSKLWSFQLNGDKGIFFRTGSDTPKFEKGDFVNFNGEAGKGNSVKVDVKSIQAKKGDAETASNGVGNLQSTGRGVSKDDYWTQREVRDVATQRRIERQSCRNSALEFMKILLDKGEVKLPAKNKVEALEAMLTHYQEVFLKDNAGEKIEPLEDNTSVKLEEQVPY